MQADYPEAGDGPSARAVRFPCSAYRQYALGARSGDATAMRRYWADVAADVDRDDWTRAALDVAPTLYPDDFTP